MSLKYTEPSAATVTPSVNSPSSHSFSSRELDGKMDGLPLGFVVADLTKGAEQDRASRRQIKKRIGVREN